MTERIRLKNCPISGFADEIDTAVDDQIKLLKDLGISWIEFRSGDGVNVADYTLEQARALREKLDSHQIRISALGSPIGKIGIGEDFAAHLEKLAHVIRVAKLLGTDKIRMFSFFMPEGEDPAKYKEEVFLRTRAMVELAAKENILLLHENEKGIYGDNAARCLELMEAFYGPHYQCTFDFANFVQCGQDTQQAYELLKPYISYIHVKDALFADGSVVPAGEGDGQVKRIFELLDRSGYTGVLSLEPHLADFAGLKDLEKNAQTRGRSDGEAAFTLAYRALEGLLSR